MIGWYDHLQPCSWNKNNDFHGNKIAFDPILYNWHETIDGDNVAHVTTKRLISINDEPPEQVADFNQCATYCGGYKSVHFERPINVTVFAIALTIALT